jgi:hypothetical protein
MVVNIGVNKVCSIIYVFNMIILAFEKFYSASVGLSLLVFLVDFQLLELVQACTSLYKCPQENCGNTDGLWNQSRAPATSQRGYGLEVEPVA